ncbi:hypothetical protein V6C16_12445, partial [Desulfovibrio sp. 1188_IL3213]|uniref:hypothetical protein n=1 Tax=Desulfovibrio sp. 1188_IL3213 TaxID=3084052 RepID=UPI002FDA0724
MRDRAQHIGPQFFLLGVYGNIRIGAGGALFFHGHLAEIGLTMPDGLDYTILVNTNDFVLESIREVVSTLVEAMILV